MFGASDEEADDDQEADTEKAWRAQRFEREKFLEQMQVPPPSVSSLKHVIVFILAGVGNRLNFHNQSSVWPIIANRIRPN